MSLSAFILVVWSVGLASNDAASLSGFIVSPIAAIIAGVTFAASLVLYVLARRKPAWLHWCSLISYLLICLSAGAIIMTTGHTKSPFIMIWLLLGMFAGLYGVVSFILICVAEAAYVTYLFIQQPVGTVSITAILLVFVTPVIVSMIIWRKQVIPDSNAETDKAYNELARELSQVSNKSDIVINAIADGVMAVDGKGIIQLINPAAQTILGWGKQDAIGLDYRSVLKLFDGKDAAVPDDVNPVQQVLATNTPSSRDDLSLVTSAGKKMMMSFVISPVGQLGSGCIIVFRDITSEVVENRQKAEFVSTASHEMRTPVAAIEGYISLALNPQTATIDDKARSYLQKAHESANHLGELFQDLLDISKAEDGRLGSNPVTIDLLAFLRDVISTVQTSAAASHITLTFVPDTDTAAATIQPAYFVNVDTGHLREVISNLITNAIKYTKPGGTATIDVTGDDNRVTISVVDTGIGIPAEDIPHLFQKFYRVDNTDTREIGGTGLGLYLCRRLVESMNGRIWLESTYGKGSMFFVELPRVAPPAADQEQPLAPEPGTEARGNQS